MTQAHMLTRHRDIQNWVNDRRGTPAIARVRDRFGQARAQLKLRFAEKPKAVSPSVEDGMSPCSWTAWLAELDRQQLALRVEPTGQFELVSRQALN
jgi:hypothetical protein